MALMPDGRTLAIANGGIETHPDFGRAKLNLSTMKPSLVFVDRISGDLLEQHFLPAEFISYRSATWTSTQSGTVWFGCQYEGPTTDRPLLVGKARIDTVVSSCSRCRKCAWRLAQLCRFRRCQSIRWNSCGHFAARQQPGDYRSCNGGRYFVPSVEGGLRHRPRRFGLHGHNRNRRGDRLRGQCSNCSRLCVGQSPAPNSVNNS